ncbi:MAG: hypothetical protein IIX94_03030 [Clostridia bacterium]|nr:hypothetical protein [Clostridia bacterium]
MSIFKVGFSRVNINPVMGTPICGYYKERFAEGILDDLEVNVLALEYDEKRAAMLCFDLLGVTTEAVAILKDRISEKTGLAKDAIFISGTHTHTGPTNRPDEELGEKYWENLYYKATDAVVFALDDLKDAKVGYGIGEAPNVAFVRRFRMKDGSVRTNPGVNNPDILHPIGDVDERVSVIRFDREGAETIVLVNFANHPDVVGGSKISADWPGLTRKVVEKTIDNTKCIFFNGAQGDVNHVNVAPTGGFLNGMFMDFDDVSRGYPHALYIARVVTGGVLQCYDKVKYVDIDSLKYKVREISLASNMPTPEELPEAEYINKMHVDGRDDELPYEGMMLTTMVADAARKIRLKDGPDAFSMNLAGISFGPIAFVGIPGEPFTGIGRGIKDTEGFEIVIPCALTNGYKGYFPMKDAYDEGGYEARSSNFKTGVAENIIKEGKLLLKDLGEGK